MVNGERSLLVLAGAGSGKTSVLVARGGLAACVAAKQSADQILLLAFGRQAAQEMDERIQERLAYGRDYRAYFPFTGVAYYSAGQQESAGDQ